MTYGDRTVIVTGAASPRGIGRAAAHRMARDGWSVALLDVDGDAISKAANQIAEAHGLPTTAVTADITNEVSVDSAISQVERDLPPVQALFNIAGITLPARFGDTTLDQWAHVLRVNATGTFIVTKRVVPAMVSSRHGRIVNMSSVSAQQGGGVFGGVAYSASKGAILGFTKALARELAPANVTVNAVTPGVIDTDIREGFTNPEREAALAAGVPLGRQGTVDEVAALFAFLASQEAGYITGSIYDINGGSHIH